MAASPLNPKALFRSSRSTSFPSRFNPLTLTVEQHLNVLRASSSSDETTTSSSTFICHNLSTLKDLFDRVDNLIHLPLIQASIANQKSDKCVNEVLDGSLRLLDVCGITIDVLSQMKECLQDLQSSLRRKRDQFGLGNELATFVVCRKKLTKVIRNCLKDIKRTEMSNKCFFSSDKNHEEIMAIIRVLGEVEATTLSIFGSILLFISSSKARSKHTGWSLVSKLMMHTTNVISDGEDSDGILHQMEKILSSLSCTTKSQKLGEENDIAIDQVENRLKRLEAFELSIQELEEGLACVSRCLITTRFSFLNTLNH